MNRKLLFLLLTAHVGFASATEKTDNVGNKPLPAGAVLMCGEHIIGQSPDKPVHISWQAFGLHDETVKTVQFYQTQFGRPPAPVTSAQSYTWKFTGEQNELHYSVQTPSTDGPWSGCAIKPANFKTVILISNATFVKGR
jgi:hypothetical protein